mmetsp:Transcript_103541/g.267799  ORF Transcript_103541/g.267799 Transcript_103541/m.267799 type:complete len:818 (+) Transcript_103541:48-2501(+)
MGNSDSHGVFVDGVKKLLAEDVPEDSQEFWSSLFSAPMSIEDVFEIVGPDHVRQLRQKRPKNLQAFLRRIVATMSDVCKAADEGNLPAAMVTTASTVIRLLTRIVPFLLEEPEDAVVQALLWRPGGFQVDGAQASPAPNGASEAARIQADAEPAASPGAVAPGQAACGNDILHYIMRFLFLPGFTVTPRSKMTGKERGPLPTHRVDDRVVWKGGVGVAASVTAMPSGSHSKTRAEVLRCVLACLSGPLFLSAEEYQESPPAWLTHFTSGEVCHTANLFCSLMSSVFAYEHWSGWGLPYGGYLRNVGEEELVDVALQVMCVVMDFDPIDDDPATRAGSAVVKEKPDEAERDFAVDNSELQAQSHGLGYRKSKNLEDMNTDQTALWGSTVRGIDEGDGWVKVQGSGYLPLALNGKVVLLPQAAPEKKKKKMRNVYRYMLQNIHKDAEIDLIFNGIVRLLSTVHQANQTYLPNSSRSVGFYQEALVLLWHLLTLNPNFTQRVVDHLDTNQVVLPVLYLLQQAQDAPQLVGLLHTASFVLLVLSSERSFAVRLNEPYSGKVPLSLPAFQGCHADVVALALHKVISDSISRPQNDALVEMLLTVLCNVSPYIKCFALESCLKLLSLIDRCSRPAYIFRSAFTHHGLIFLIEMLNNIIQYQYEGNAMLVYSTLRQKEVFHRLADLKLPQRPPSQSQIEESTESADGTPAEDVPWNPNEAWLASLKKKMPLQAIVCLIDYLAPHVEVLCKKFDVIDQDEVLKYLKMTTMVGILPVPHPIVIRTYQASSYTAMWFTSYMWGVIFTRSQRMPLYDWKKIRLVVINQ